MNKLRRMMIFKGVVESGSLTKAADKLSLSKSVISQHLKKLEEEIGAPLLYRNTRSQSLTNVGKDFYTYCLEISHLSELAWEKARAKQSEISGQLTVTASYALMQTIVAPALCKLIKAHSKIRLNLINEDRPLNLVERGIDLAVRVGKSADVEQSQQYIGSFRDVLYKAKDSEFDVGTAPYIANSWEGKVANYQFMHTTQNIVKPLSFRAHHKTNSVSDTIRLIESGLGIGLVPEIIAFDNHKLERVDPDFELEKVEIFCIHKGSIDVPATIQIAQRAIKSYMDAHQFVLKSAAMYSCT
ncbi:MULTISPECIES: LysR family transcriptional regulator [Pseudoalteromonas]|uniref:LysR family transcriptional regulator n=1 Tax=Pseudoalteromonas TaxID=53246 RepID=UPI0011099110|nr:MULTISPECIES: LysR family transcriptional regulator [Pseudoalteromonas]MCG9761793.1 LysR family transcriptional regulator [Pseudoalteromonas sp. Isolate6]NKC20846.1 LysR family transcriptional regulator [Pseudoalteromonas galatheae]